VRKLLSIALCFGVCAVLALSTAGCPGKKKDEKKDEKKGGGGQKEDKITLIEPGTVTVEQGGDQKAKIEVKRGKDAPKDAVTLTYEPSDKKIKVTGGGEIAKDKSETEADVSAAQDAKVDEYKIDITAKAGSTEVGKVTMKVKVTKKEEKASITLEGKDVKELEQGKKTTEKIMVERKGAKAEAEFEVKVEAKGPKDESKGLTASVKDKKIAKDAKDFELTVEAAATADEGVWTVTVTPTAPEGVTGTAASIKVTVKKK
jgi:uncharacterized membrane protein